MIYYGIYLELKQCFIVLSWKNILKSILFMTFTDPLRTAKGNLSLRALKLNSNIMKLYKEGRFAPEWFINIISYS